MKRKTGKEYGFQTNKIWVIDIYFPRLSAVKIHVLTISKKITYPALWIDFRSFQVFMSTVLHFSLSFSFYHLLSTKIRCCWRRIGVDLLTRASFQIGSFFLLLYGNEYFIWGLTLFTSISDARSSRFFPEKKILFPHQCTLPDGHIHHTLCKLPSSFHFPWSTLHYLYWMLLFPSGIFISLRTISILNAWKNWLSSNIYI